uniref:phenylalanine--tRNA ligase n=1 Tax=Platysiphonia delicata TaxID=2006979 RepID=A0A1Z1M198_9FLOR|nr:Phenylalanine-tRNA ligase beta subunit [Platysiphonia delicata]ARW59680.1 Phenylalanine-tRNA ligase beta subunit [Platysiphonia delicata]
MKFAWKNLNYFINLKCLKLEETIKYLTLAGFEIDNIEKNTIIEDQVITLSNTTNRKEINSIFNLANEISIIFNLKLKIKTILSSKDKINLKQKKYKKIKYIKFNIITNIENKSSPEWLKNYLFGCNKKVQFLLKDIEEYIKVKWGQKVLFFDLTKIKLNTVNYKLIKSHRTFSENEMIDYNKERLFSITKYDILVNKKYVYDKNTSNIMLCYFVCNDDHNIVESISMFNNIHYEIIKTISRLGKGIIQKSQYNINKFSEKRKKITIHKNYIKQILGPLNKSSRKLLSNQQIKISLNQMKFESIYSKNRKLFLIKVPHYRNHDLVRDIDIVEEIARIHGFSYFLDQLPEYKKRGKVSIKTSYVKKIRRTLQMIGFNEIMSCSLVNTNNKKNTIKLYNPIAEDQKYLKNNLLKSIIQNHLTNIKQDFTKTEIFEIGRIFNIDNDERYIENNHLGGLVNNNKFIQKDWSGKIEELNWFHAKNILEYFFKILNAHIKWHTSLNVNNKVDKEIQSTEKYYDKYNKVYICNNLSTEMIGLFGEINYEFFKTSTKKRTFIFEINIDKLIKTIYLKKHLKYIIKPYSVYPGVTRDISIEVKKNTPIEKIKKLIINKNSKINFVESIKLISEYYQQQNNKRFLCFRITYRSISKTLNTEDLKSIDKNIKYLFRKE